jgi:hypothetical protein
MRSGNRRLARDAVTRNCDPVIGWRMGGLFRRALFFRLHFVVIGAFCWVAGCHVVIKRVVLCCQRAADQRSQLANELCVHLVRRVITFC